MVRNAAHTDHRVGQIQPREARWFIAGDVAWPVSGRPKRRVDAYHLTSLTPTCSWKRRGEHGAVEHKVLVAAEHVTIDGVDAVAEQWVKRPSGDVVLRGRWVEVHKELWRGAGVEVGRVVVGDEPWWTVAVVVDGSWSRAKAHRFSAWTDLLRARGVVGSYPRWLIDAAQAAGGCP